MINHTNRRTYWLLFRESPMWTQMFLKKGFGHIQVVYNDGFNWMILDPRVNRLDVRVLPFSIAEDVPRNYMQLFPSWKVLKVELGEDMSPAIIKPFAFVTCTTVVKYFLGYKERCFTPWGLYKSLLRRSRKRNKKGLRKVYPLN